MVMNKQPLWLNWYADFKKVVRKWAKKPYTVEMMDQYIEDNRLIEAVFDHSGDNVEYWGLDFVCKLDEGQL